LRNVVEVSTALLTIVAIVCFAYLTKPNFSRLRHIHLL